MKPKLKNTLLIISAGINFIFILLFVMAANSSTSRISFYTPAEDHITGAAVISFPASGEASFDLIELTLKPRDKAHLQFSFFADNRQGNVLINAIYDREIISVTQTGYGIEITALAEGSTLMQTLTNDGVKNMAFISVE